MDPLSALLDDIRACRVCRDAPQRLPGLPHEPRPVVRISSTARLLVSGQAPGTRVHASGAPFTDPSGVRLRDWLGLDEATFYDVRRVAVVPMGFCFPGLDAKGSDLPPRRECAPRWHDALFAARPVFGVVVALGRPAQAYHLARLGRPDLVGPSLDATVHDWERIVAATGLFPLPHPSWRNNAWLKRNPWFADTLLPVLRDAVRDALA